MSKLDKIVKMVDEMENLGFENMIEYILSSVNSQMDNYKVEFKKNNAELSNNIYTSMHKNVMSVMVRKESFDYLQKLVKDLGT